MLFVKFATILMCVLIVLIPVVIYFMLRSNHNFDSWRRMARKLYPGLFHGDRIDDNS